MSVAPSSFATFARPPHSDAAHGDGPLTAAALEDPDVVEVMLNPDRTLWVDRLSSGRAPMGVELSEVRTASESSALSPPTLAQKSIAASRYCPPNCPKPANASRVSCRPPRQGRLALRKRALGVIPLERYVIDGMTSAQAGCSCRARAAERPDRRRHQQRQDHARQCAAGRDRRHGRPRAGARRHGGTAMRGPRPRSVAHPRRRGVDDRACALVHAPAA